MIESDSEESTPYERPGRMKYFPCALETSLPSSTMGEERHQPSLNFECSSSGILYPTTESMIGLAA
ncbi:hypothetical protein RIB2604_02008140 [Aspergillus luchuensis]|uniref:Uncharacterized protein n=1 Tax=Aspergillus kawachii TaxID=1069201 RepID=A0A146FM34_ASPKA|nr:hypothetical protein RIB2604_02008140 [Aspergillus luchuensis]